MYLPNIIDGTNMALLSTLYLIHCYSLRYWKGPVLIGGTVPSQRKRSVLIDDAYCMQSPKLGTALSQSVLRPSWGRF